MSDSQELRDLADLDEYYLPYAVWMKGTVQWWSPIIDDLVVCPRRVGHA